MSRTLAPALIALLLVVTACATEADDAAVEVPTGPEAAVMALRSAPDAAVEAGSARFEMTMEMSRDGEASELVSTGAFDAVHQRMAMEMDMGAMFEQLAASTGVTVPEELDEPMQIVADGSALYLRLPVLDMLGGPTGWLSLTPDDLGATADSLGLGAGSYDPSKILESLRGVTGEPELVGTEEVRGVETTRYTATMDLADAVAEVPADRRAAVKAQLEQLGGAEVPVDVWIGGDGLPRRMQIDMSDTLGSVGGRAVMAMEFFDYGEPVDIQVPSPDEVQSLTESLGAVGESFGDAS